MKKWIVIFLLLTALPVYGQVSKDTVIFDKVIDRGTTQKARVASVNIDVVNQKVVVVYQLGNLVDGQFVVVDQKTDNFSTEDGKTDFTDILAGMKIDLNDPDN